MIEYVLIGYPIIAAAGLGGLALGRRGWTYVRDKITAGKFNREKQAAEMILHNIRTFPSLWKIDPGMARFPREGAARVLLDKKGNVWRYSLGDDFHELSIFYGKQIEDALDTEYKSRHTRYLVDTFSDEKYMRLLK